MARKKQEVIQEPMEAFLDEARAAFGEDAVMSMDQKPKLSDNVIATGSIQLDLALGIGGWPLGRIFEIFGPESCGKSTLAALAVRAAQKNDQDVLFIDTENGLDPKYMAALGVDLHRLQISQPDSMEIAMDVAVMAVGSGAFSLVVLDSIPACVPQAVADGSAEDSHYALHARILSQNLPKINNILKNADCSLMMINQTREKMNVTFGSPETQPGGKAPKFYSSIRIRMYRTVEGKKEDGAEGQFVHLDVIKNKVAPPFCKAMFFLPAGGPPDPVGDVLNAASAFNDIVQEGVDRDGNAKQNWYRAIDSEGEVICAVYRWEAFKDEIRTEHPEFIEYARNLIMERSMEEDVLEAIEAEDVEE